jgi:hypothetical protein
MIVALSYNVEVLAVVDTETDTIERVRVMDEQIEPNLNDEGFHVAYAENGGAVPNEHLAEAQRAREIADGAAWPGWSFG